MVRQDCLLVLLLELVDRIPMPARSTQIRGRGRPAVYSDRLFLKALVILIVRRLRTVHEMLAVLDQPTPQTQCLRSLLCENGRYPSRRTFERRLAALPETLPQQIGCLGRHLVGLLDPWADCGRAVVMDSTVLRAKGAVWHKKDREAGVVPHPQIDTEASWTKSGWHGWVYGWKLHLAGAVADVWIPLAAELTEASRYDGEVAVQLLPETPLETRYVLGDQHYSTDELRAACHLRGIELLTSKRGKDSQQAVSSAEMRRAFQMLRSRAIENLNEHFKSIFEAHEKVPTKGKVATARFALGSVFVYQLALLYRFEHEVPRHCLNVGLKHFLRAA